MWSVFKKELYQFFGNLSGYIAIVLFLLVTGIFLFVLRDSNVFDDGYATMDKFFDLAPWVLLFMIPAITMRSFSDEFRSGTFEILKTRPLSNRQIVVGKYLSVLVVLLFVIAPTLLYVFSLKMLSASHQVDSGGITGSYIGLFFLGAVFGSIGVCSSSLTNNAVVAFLIASFLCLTIYFGFNAISKLPVFEGGADYYIEMFGIDFHYKSMSRGLLDGRDVIYFLSNIFLFLLITIKRLQKRQ